MNKSTKEEFMISKLQLSLNIASITKYDTPIEKITAINIIDKKEIKNSIILASIKFDEFIPKIFKIKF